MERSSQPQESVNMGETATAYNLDDPTQHGVPNTQLISALNLRRRDVGSMSATPSGGSTPVLEEKIETSSPSNLSLYQKFKESK